jgi:hypothetical protein
VRTQIVYAAAVVALVASSATKARSPQERPRLEQLDPQAVGPQVGERVPAFTLQDQRGTTRTLASVMGAKGLMLVFFRSADW